MKITSTHDYADDSDTQTVEVITSVTTEGCIVSEREYAYHARNQDWYRNYSGCSADGLRRSGLYFT